jgi:hypothetical protein
MQWFKHNGSFRQSPAMLYVAQQLGDHGVAGVYRLYEVFTQRFGVDNDFAGSILLSPPFSETWLAQEILTPLPDDDANPYDQHRVPLKQLHRFLSVCADARLIELTVEDLPCYVRNDKGVPEQKGTATWRTITIPGFAELADEYTARKRTSKALTTPE